MVGGKEQRLDMHNINSVISTAAPATAPAVSTPAHQCAMLNLTAYFYAGTFVGCLGFRSIGVRFEALCMRT